MAPLVGRDQELAQIQKALETCRDSRVAGTFHIAGPSGIGKSALFAAATERAVADGWLVGAATCHRIQVTLPYVTARHIANALIGALGPQGERYSSGLGPLLNRAPRGKAASSEKVSEGLFRLVEAVLLDYPLLVAIDDAQWIDPQSRDVIDQLVEFFSDRPLALLSAGWTAPAGPELERTDQFLNLGRITPRAAADLVTMHYANAKPPVIEAIVAHAAGHPIDVVALAQAARDASAVDAVGVEASVRAVVARELNNAPADLREFLQLCAMIPEPIAYGVLAQLWPDEPTLARLLGAASKRYLLQEGSALRFAHAVLAEAIRQTVPVEIPFRRRILNALTAIERPGLEDLERIVQQTDACGDFAMSRIYLMQMAAQAVRESALFTASHAFERALEIASPSAADLVRFYLDYTSVLTMQSRMSDTKTVTQRALKEAARQGITKGLGGLAATFLIALWSTQGYAEALEAYQILHEKYTAVEDRLQLHSVAAWLYSCAVDQVGFTQQRQALLSIVDELPPEIAMRLKIAEACLRLRQGDGPSATSLIDAAVLEAASVPSANRRSAEISRACIHFLRFGLRDIESEPALQSRGAGSAARTPMLDYIDSICALSKGALDDAADLVREAMPRSEERSARRSLLSVAAAIAALTEDAGIYREPIDAELRDFSAGQRDDAFLPLAAWRSVSLCATRPSEARNLLHRVIEALAGPINVEVLLFPIALSVTAARLNDLPALKQLCTSTDIWQDQAPWHVAQRQLAVGHASEFLKRGSGKRMLTDAVQGFGQLGSPLFCALAGYYLDANDEQATAFLLARGALNFVALRPSKPANAAGNATRLPSRRELEIIKLVAEGNTNREIAENLVLSERTVEAHIANIFGKLNVSRRAQIAAWHASLSLPAASQTYHRTV